MENTLHGKNRGWESVKNLLNYQENNAKLIYNNKPSYDINKAAEQLSRDLYKQEWAKKHKNSEPLTITYTFTDWEEYSNGIYQGANLTVYNPKGLTPYQQKQAKLALQAWEDVANIKLVKVDSMEKATINFGYYDGYPSEQAYTWIKSTYHWNYSTNSLDTNIKNTVWCNSNISNLKHPTSGDYGRNTYIHEVGHALGLPHPGNYESTNGGHQHNALYKEDSRQYSVMSYWSETETGGNNQFHYSAAPLMHDIAAIQKIHGANTTTRTGDTVYGFNSNTDRDFYTLTDSKQKAVFCIWDAGGNDTLDFSKYSQNQRINLNEASFSDVGGLKANVSIAQHTIIENAIGGLGNDVIVGNAADNILEGGKGDDIIYGGKGRDMLWGSNGNAIAPNKRTNDQPANEVDDSFDDEPPLEDYTDNEVSNSGWTTSPWGGYNVNPYCPWTNPSCYNNGYVSSYYSAPTFNGFNNGFTYSFWPGQYYGNNVFYNAAYPNQQGYCNNNNYGYCKQQTKFFWQPDSDNLIIDNYSGSNNGSYYHNDKKTQKTGNGNDKDIFVFASIEDSPFNNPDVIMDFETGIDKIDFSAFKLPSPNNNPISPYFVDHSPQKTGEMQLTYDKEYNLSHLLLNASNDDTPDFALDIYGVIKESDFMLA